MPSSKSLIVERELNGQFVEVFSTTVPEEATVQLVGEDDHVHVQITETPAKAPAKKAPAKKKAS